MPKKHVQGKYKHKEPLHVYIYFYLFNANHFSFHLMKELRIIVCSWKNSNNNHSSKFAEKDTQLTPYNAKGINDIQRVEQMTTSVT